MKRTGTESVEYLYDLGGSAVTTLSVTDGSWIRGEIYAGGHHIGSYADATTYFTHSDWLGTQRARTQMDGGLHEWCTNLPFGDAQSCSGSDPSPRHFTGKERDSESGLDNFGARYNASSLGRFMTPDPIFITKKRIRDPQQWNLYSYVRNNPINLTDPTGLDFNQNCSENNGTTCQGGYVYYKDENGDYRKTVIKSDEKGNLTDQSRNKYTGTFDGKSVTFADAKGAKSTGYWIQGSGATSGVTAGGKLDSRFSFTFENHGGHQELNAIWSFRGTVAQAEAAWQQAGYEPRKAGINVGFDEFRTPAEDRSSRHANVDQVPFEPKSGQPTTFGDVHTGEYDPEEHPILHGVCDLAGAC